MTDRPDGKAWGHADNLKAYGAAQNGTEADARRAWEKIAPRLDAPACASRPYRRFALVTVVTLALIAVSFWLYPGKARVTVTPSSPPPTLAVSPAPAPVQWTVAGAPRPFAAGEVFESDDKGTTLSLGTRARAVLHPRTAVTVRTTDAEMAVLRGTVEFEVIHDRSAPAFRVKAGGALVTVTGTAFTVALDSNAVSVHVTDGVVEVAWRGETVVVHGDDTWSSAKEPATPALLDEERPAPARERTVRENAKTHPVQTPRAARPEPGDRVESERLAAILDTWHRQKDPARCLKLADEYQAEFPAGILAQEVRYLRLLSLNALGHDAQFREGYEQFRAAAPGSPYLKELEGLAKNKD